MWHLNCFFSGHKKTIPKRNGLKLVPNIVGETRLEPVPNSLGMTGIYFYPLQINSFIDVPTKSKI